MKQSKKPIVLVILGPTATGKSNLAVELALKFNGEVISADSRQVYKKLTIGTGKITTKEMRGVPHHLIDVIDPKKIFSVSQWNKRAIETIHDILSRNRLPIICGGTGFYIQSIVENTLLPNVPPNADLRKKLEKMTLPDLVSLLTTLDPVRIKTIDIQNPVRIIRAIEIATTLGSVPTLKKQQNQFACVQIGLTADKEILHKKIHDRLLTRITQGMIEEAKKLHAEGISYKRMNQLGLEYRYLALFLQKKLSKEEMIAQLETKINQYARRQMQWFIRDKKIKWFDIKEIDIISAYIEKNLVR